MPVPEHLSPSGWNTWDICPRQWASKYLLDIQAPVGPEAEIGSFDHKVFEAMYNRSASFRTLPGARHLAGLVWRDHAPIPSIVNGKISEAEFKTKAWEGIAGLFKIEKPELVDVAATEQEVKWTENGVPFLARVDRVDNGPDSLGRPGKSVIDYKTGKLPPKERMPINHRQVVIGTMGVAATMGDDGVSDTGYLLYTTKPKAVPVDTGLEARLTVSREAKGVWGQMRALVDSGASWDEYPADAKSLCAWCMMADRCPEGRARVRADLSTWLTPERAPGAMLVAIAEGYVEEKF